MEELSKDLSQTGLRYFLDNLKERNIAVEEGEARACLGNFGLGGKLASDTPIGALSGGQKVSEFTSRTNRRFASRCLYCYSSRQAFCKS